MFLGGLWGVVAVGALLFAIALLTDRPQLLRWVVWAWIVTIPGAWLIASLTYALVAVFN